MSTIKVGRIPPTRGIDLTKPGVPEPGHGATALRERTAALTTPLQD